MELRNVNSQLAAARGEIVSLRAAAGTRGVELEETRREIAALEAKLESTGVAHAEVLEVEAAALCAASTAAETAAEVAAFGL